MSLWDLILRSRRKARMTQQDLAEKVGVNRATVSLWERNERLPTLMALHNLSRVFEWPDDIIVSAVRGLDGWQPWE